MQLGSSADISPDVLIQHLEIMNEEGLIEAEILAATECCFAIHKLTWKGHDFLANARNETTWKQVMIQIKDKGLALTISVITGLLSKESLKLAGLGQ
jgi:DNA-binding HxlR family transcriptional regulator